MKFNMEEIKKLKKPDLKKFINQNGGFTKLRLETLGSKKAPKEIKDKVPEGAIYFEGVASDGSLNMNGYKIRPQAFEEAGEQYINDFGGIVYYQHDMDNPIGKTLSYKVQDDKVVVQGYVFDEYAEGKISKGLVADLSTGHYTVGVEYENAEDESDIISEEEFDSRMENIREESKSYDDFMTKAMAFIESWILAVTELIRVEYSFVTVGSNTQARVTQLNNSELCTNAISKRLGADDSESLKESLKNSYIKHLESKKDNNAEEGTTDSEEAVEVEDKQEEADAGVEPTETTEPTPEDDNGEKTDDSVVEESEETEEPSEETVEETEEKVEENSVETDAETEEADEESVETEEPSAEEADEAVEEKVEEETAEDGVAEEKEDLSLEINTEESPEGTEEEVEDATEDAVEEKEDNELDMDEDLEDLLSKAVKEMLGLDEESTRHVRIMDIYEEEFVYNYFYNVSEDDYSDKYYRLGYSYIDGSVELVGEPVEVEVKRSRVDKTEQLKKDLTVDLDKAEKPEEVDGDEESENDGEEPEANNLNMDEVKILKSEISTLKATVKESEELMQEAAKVISQQDKLINEMSEKLEKARQITVKNGVYNEHKEEKEETHTSKLYNQLTNAYHEQKAYRG